MRDRVRHYSTLQPTRSTVFQSKSGMTHLDKATTVTKADLVSKVKVQGCTYPTWARRGQHCTIEEIYLP